MSDLPQKRQARRGRIFPEYTVPPEEIARRRAERTELGLRCRAVFERIRPELMEKYYNWLIAIEPNTGEYVLDRKLEGLIQKIKERYGDADIKMTAFRLNEEGYCGRI
ncbi:hypothetical protein H6S82_16850 [Planktothrix sp. FACHB-1355]|uniref:Uncharacterized protein n=1 Tax=Aerosakkonema funiforme FACHB-1375 TaxID=2949571 RepID=A0A926VCZ0_9CYAN|nr:MULTISPECIES: hypothetical protein [Oscillatoriales]MBD2180254.1 hypothetical protein [Aerosakkonema funiforme FACHB-1375]MBD3560506.1 hypothetical protein [Planktothrix sp. FACHB-1355]